MNKRQAYKIGRRGNWSWRTDRYHKGGTLRKALDILDRRGEDRLVLRLLSILGKM